MPWETRFCELDPTCSSQAAACDRWRHHHRHPDGWKLVPPVSRTANAYAGADSLVMIGQFTTDTTLYGVISIASICWRCSVKTALRWSPWLLAAWPTPCSVARTAMRRISTCGGQRGQRLLACSACDYPGYATDGDRIRLFQPRELQWLFADGFASVTVIRWPGEPVLFQWHFVNNATGLFNRALWRES